MKRLLLLASSVATQRSVMHAGRALDLAVVSVASLAGASREARASSFAAGLFVVADTDDDEGVSDLLKQLAPSPVLLLTSDADMTRALAMLTLGFADLARLPLQADYLVHRLRSTLQRGPRIPAATSGGARVEWLLGTSSVMEEIRQRLKKLAETDLTVAVYGESGTGKELAARTIHAQSARAMGPLIVANCAAMPESLFENELFGHERGSYTGATRSTGGLVEEAASGTLVLDEIGELALPLQSKLLRFLQFGTYRRVGGTRELRSDARVVVITNRFLPDAIAEKTFRADLFYRIHLLHAVMPPLRSRVEDIPLLSEFIAEQFCRRYDRPRPTFSPEALARLVAHDWPGNVRELEGVVQTTLALHDGSPTISAEHVQSPTWETPTGTHFGVSLEEAAPEPVRLRVARVEAGAALESSEASAPFALDGSTLSEAKQRAVQSFEVNYIRRLLTATAGNLAEAARQAGTDRKTLWRLLRKHGIEAVDFKRRPRKS